MCRVYMLYVIYRRTHCAYYTIIYVRDWICLDGALYSSASRPQRLITLHGSDKKYLNKKPKCRLESVWRNAKLIPSHSRHHKIARRKETGWKWKKKMSFFFANTQFYCLNVVPYVSRWEKNNKNLRVCRFVWSLKRSAVTRCPQYNTCHRLMYLLCTWNGSYTII